MRHFNSILPLPALSIALLALLGFGTDLPSPVVQEQETDARLEPSGARPTAPLVNPIFIGIADGYVRPDGTCWDYQPQGSCLIWTCSPGGTACNLEITDYREGTQSTMNFDCDSAVKVTECASGWTIQW